MYSHFLRGHYACLLYSFTLSILMNLKNHFIYLKKIKYHFYLKNKKNKKSSSSIIFTVGKHTLNINFSLFVLRLVASGLQ